MNDNLIRRILPHRDPILLVDEILKYNIFKIGKEQIWCQKTITGEEPVLAGHFPNQPIWPGVYTVEGFAQSAALLVYFMAERDGKKLQGEGYFAGIDKTRFSGLVVPGDVLIYSVSFLKEKRGFYYFACEAHVKNKRVAKAEIMIIVK